ncbi:linoleate 9/13-lipoxygenase-like isoform X2 [Sycon ciliatum]|uniref:linoleate 9/13-lipoxygenase-like isoform X2 n=1 Tax=Sycon ciliatum TaxID=27933 RepID=UPI0031F6DA1C
MRSALWLSLAALLVFQALVPARADDFLFSDQDEDQAKSRERRGTSSLLEKLLGYLKLGNLFPRPDVDHEGCPPASSVFGQCNNSWTDVTQEEIDAEADALIERRAQNPTEFVDALQQPLREHIEPNAQFQMDLAIDPEWSAVYTPIIQSARQLAGLYNQLNPPTGELVTEFDTYANVTNFFRETYSNSPPIPAEYRPWTFHPATDPNITVDARWNDDRVFAASRLAGYNPGSIYRIGSRGLPLSKVRQFRNTDFDWDSAVQAASGYTYRQAVLRGRLYAQYHPILQNITIFRGAFAGEKFLTPFAVFVLPRGKQDLRPVAIQLGLSRTSPVHSPESSFFWWTYSKIVANNANSLENNIEKHLHNSHFTGGRFAVVTQAEVAPNHPLRILLDPHFRGVHQTNSIGEVSLFSRGSVLDFGTLLTFDGTAEYLAQSYQQWNYREMNLHREVAYRGCRNLPYYPYYHDGLQVYRLLQRYVRSYVRLYYCCDRQVRNDETLQRWVAVLANDIYQGRAGLPSRIDSVSELSDLLTNILWLFSGYHDAYNFPNAELIYSPAAGLIVALRPEEINATLAAATTEDNLGYFTSILGTLTPTLATQSTSISLTGMKFQDLLGNSPAAATVDERTETLHEFIQGRLDTLEERLTEENRMRLARGQLPYRHMLPSQLTGSISV